MPKVTKSSSKKKTTAKVGTAKATTPKSSTAESSAAAEAKREAREKLTTEQMNAVVKRVVNGDEKLAVVAKDLKITSGKAAFLIMLHRVSEGEVPKITGKNDDALIEAISKARAKADEFSSWGWLAARSGKSEGWIKTSLEAAGKYKPKAENIASLRSASKPKAEKKSGGKSGGKTKVKGNA